MRSPEERIVDLQKKIMQFQNRGIAFCYSVLHNYHSAEEAYQEAAVVAIRRIDSFDDGNFQPWFWTILRNVLGTRIRSLRRSRVFADSTMLERLEKFHSEPVEDETQIDKLAECLRKLPHTLREVLEARYLHAKECNQIAGEMSRTIQSVYSLVKRAKQLLKACMEHESPNEVAP